MKKTLLAIALVATAALAVSANSFADNSAPCDKTTGVGCFTANSAPCNADTGVGCD